MCDLGNDDAVSWLVILLENCLTLAFFALTGRGALTTFDLAHPIFALIAQESFVMLTCSCVNVATVVLMALVGHHEEIFAVYIFVCTFALQFHQITYLLVTSLRHYMLDVQQKGRDIDLAALRTFGLRCVWLAELVFLPLCQFPWLIISSRMGWPEVQMWELRAKDEWYFLKVLAPTIVVSNIPDYVSIVMYFKMWRKARSSVANAIPEVDAADDGYGGIWMGAAGPIGEPEIAAGPIGDPEIAADPIGEPEIAAPAPNPPNRQEKQLSALSSTLKWSSLLALVDLCSVAIDPIACLGSPGLTAIFTVQMTLCFWVPLFVVGRSFEQFGGLFGAWRRAVSCWGRTND